MHAILKSLFLVLGLPLVNGYYKPVDSSVLVIKPILFFALCKSSLFSVKSILSNLLLCLKIRIRDLNGIALTCSTCDTVEMSRGKWRCGYAAQGRYLG